MLAQRACIFTPNGGVLHSLSTELRKCNDRIRLPKNMFFNGRISYFVYFQREEKNPLYAQYSVYAVE